MLHLKNTNPSKLKNYKISFFFIAVLVGIVEFIVFKRLYPFPDFNSDSHLYIYLASSNLNLAILPVGYTVFLSIFNLITNSDYVLVSFQYTFYIFASLNFYRTIVTLYYPGKYSKIILFLLLFVNPLPIYLSNCVSNDSLSLSFTLFWFTTLLKAIKNPRTSIIITHLSVLLACLLFNNNYCLPILSILTILSLKIKPILKTASIAAFLLSITFINIQLGKISNRIASSGILSSTIGWQIANNSLYMRPNLNIDSTALPNQQIKELDHLTTSFNKRIDKESYESLKTTEPNFFITYSQSPLNKFVSLYYDKSNTFQAITSVTKASNIFYRYGTYLILHHPINYIKYFIVPNISNYFIPFIGDLSKYNLGKDKVPPLVQDWFEYQTPDIRVTFPELKSTLLSLYPYLFCLANLLFLGSIIWWVSSKTYGRLNNTERHLYLVPIAFYVINFLYSVITSIVVFKTQTFSTIICALFPLLIIEFIDTHPKLNLDKNISPYSPDLINTRISAASI